MNTETFRQAFSALRANWLRSMLTLMIIAFGIMAVVGILTAIDAAIYSINDNFSSLGANSIEIRPSPRRTGRAARGRGREARRADHLRPGADLQRSLRRARRGDHRHGGGPQRCRQVRRQRDHAHHPRRRRRRRLLPGQELRVGRRGGSSRRRRRAAGATSPWWARRS